MIKKTASAGSVSTRENRVKQSLRQGSYFSAADPQWRAAAYQNLKKTEDAITITSNRGYPRLRKFPNILHDFQRQDI